MILVPVIAFWLLAVWGSVSSRPVLLYLFFGSMAFGSFAVVSPSLTGGLTFTATPIIMLLIIMRAFVSRDGPDFFLTSALRFDRMALLFLFWVVAILATLFMPQVFADKVMVVPIREIRSGALPLQPTPQNISQLVYLSISIMTAFAFAKILRSRADRQYALKAMVFGGIMAVLTGLVDFSTQFLPIEPLLDPFRTATYSLATNVEVMGGKRVVGLMPEASSFGGMALGFLAGLVFFRRAIADQRTRNVYAPLVIGLLALLVYLSTSSGALLGLFVLVLVVLGEALLRAFSRGKAGMLYRQDLVGELSVVFGLLTITGLSFLLFPALMEPIVNLINRMVLQKAESDSFVERGLWRQVAIDSLFATSGLGVGLGGTRASSSVVAIFSNTGVLGGLLYYGFVLQTLSRRSAHMPWEGQLMLSAFRFAFIPPFVVGLLVGGTDFGGMMAFGLGLVTAVTFSRDAIVARQRGGSGRRGRSYSRAQAISLAAAGQRRLAPPSAD